MKLPLPHTLAVFCFELALSLAGGTLLARDLGKRFAGHGGMARLYTEPLLIGETFPKHGFRAALLCLVVAAVLAPFWAVVWAHGIHTGGRLRASLVLGIKRFPTALLIAAFTSVVMLSLIGVSIASGFGMHLVLRNNANAMVHDIVVALTVAVIGVPLAVFGKTFHDAALVALGRPTRRPALVELATALSTARRVSTLTKCVLFGTASMSLALLSLYLGRHDDDGTRAALILVPLATQACVLARLLVRGRWLVSVARAAT